MSNMGSFKLHPVAGEQKVFTLFPLDAAREETSLIFPLSQM